MWIPTQPTVYRLSSHLVSLQGWHSTVWSPVDDCLCRVPSVPIQSTSAQWPHSPLTKLSGAIIYRLPAVGCCCPPQHLNTTTLAHRPRVGHSFSSNAFHEKWEYLKWKWFKMRYSAHRNCLRWQSHRHGFWCSSRLLMLVVDRKISSWNSEQVARVPTPLWILGILETDTVRCLRRWDEKRFNKIEVPLPNCLWEIVDIQYIFPLTWILLSLFPFSNIVSILLPKFPKAFLSICSITQSEKSNVWRAGHNK